MKRQFKRDLVQTGEVDVGATQSRFHAPTVVSKFKRFGKLSPSKTRQFKRY